jgi:hypothetical protein
MILCLADAPRFAGGKSDNLMIMLFAMMERDA